jgi:hypothetical protein
VDLARRDPRQVEGLLLGRPVPHDGRADGVESQERHRQLGERRLVGEDQLLHRAHAAAAVLPWPAQRQPAVGAELPDQAPVRVAVAVIAFACEECLAHVGGHQRAEVFSQLMA